MPVYIPEEVRRPDDGQVFAVHAGLGAVGSDPRQVADEVLGCAVVRRRQLLHHVPDPSQPHVLILRHRSLWR